MLLISIDTLRPDHLGCYGYSRKTSPAIDRLADGGTVFDTAVSSSSWTLAAHAALFTSMPDSVHGCLRGKSVLDDSRVTLAERLQEAGYTTAGFYSGPYLHPHFGLAQGFDHYESCTGYDVDESDLVAQSGSDRKARRAHRLSHADVTSPRLLKKTRRWLAAAPSEPFFLFVHMWDVHFDFVPPEPYDRMFDPDYRGSVDGKNLGKLDPAEQSWNEADWEHLRALYDGEVAWTDHHVGLILDSLAEHGLLAQTLVVLTSDHGEEFLEHGRFGHGKTLFDESVRIPLVVRPPEGSPAKAHVPYLARIADIGPTILDYAGVEVDPASMMGRSLRPFVAGGSPPSPRIGISELVSRGDQLLAVRTLDFKILYEKGSGETIGLWDLAVDPGEQTNLVGSPTPLHALAERALAETVESLETMRTLHPRRAAPGSEVPPNIAEQLEQLGYLKKEGAGESDAAQKDGG